jgi:20S proteasome subunit alpha 3
MQTAQSTLKSEYKDDLTFADAQKVAIKTLIKAMDTASPSAEKIELQVLQRYVGVRRVG